MHRTNWRVARNSKVKPCPTVTLFSCKTWTTAAVRSVKLDCSGLFWITISFKDWLFTLVTPRELLDLNPFMIALDATAPSQDVANTSEGADLAADQQAQSHCRVQVCPAHMPKSLSQCGNGQCKGQRDLQLLSNLLLNFIFSNDGSYANEYKQQHVDILHSPPECPAFYLCHLCVKYVCCAKPACEWFSMYSGCLYAEGETGKRYNTRS